MTQVPAIRYIVQWTPSLARVPDMAHDDIPYRDSIVIFEECACHEHPDVYDSDLTNGRMVAVWDFNFDRAHDFYLPWGKYANERMIAEGIRMWYADREYLKKHGRLPDGKM
jgi:hypothetical protein